MSFRACSKNYLKLSANNASDKKITNNNKQTIV